MREAGRLRGKQRERNRLNLAAKTTAPTTQRAQVGDEKEERDSGGSLMRKTSSTIVALCCFSSMALLPERERAHRMSEQVVRVES